jgi:uncharacterized protein YegL
MKNLTDITIILDRSGSMDIIKSATIEGFNSFLKDQKADEHKSIVSLVQFDDCYDILYEGKSIDRVNYLNHQTFEPRGCTALLDAIGKTIQNTKKRLKNTSKKKKPTNVLIAIITDGEENASTHFTRKEIFKIILKREEKNGWKFVFIAANQDAILEAKKIGIHRNSALSFSADEIGMKDVMYSLSKNISNMKIAEDHLFKFTDEDREKQER